MRDSLVDRNSGARDAVTGRSLTAYLRTDSAAADRSIISRNCDKLLIVGTVSVRISKLRGHQTARRHSRRNDLGRNDLV